jgi:hypothetical protein
MSFILTNETAAPGMSKRYVTISTPQVVEIMENEGFVVSEVKSDKVRKSDPTFARHMVVFRNENLASPDGKYVPQALWMNSYNGRSRASLGLGMYRFVCANGLVVGEDYLKTSVKHIGDLATQVLDRVKEMSKDSYRVFQNVDKWSKVDLSKEKRIEFARIAAEIRFGEEKSKQFSLEEILQPRRAEDDAGDLWSTFNIVQENLTKGGIIGRNANNRQVRSKPLKAIDLDHNFNKNLWTLAEEFA